MAFVTDLLTRVGLLRTADAVADAGQPPAPSPWIATRVVVLRELMAEHASHAEIDRREADLATERALEASNVEIYQAAGLETEPDAWTIDRAAAIATQALKAGVSRSEVGEALAEQLRAAHVAPERLLADAAVRDNAVDRYEAHLIAAVGARDEALVEEAGALLRQIEAAQERLEQAQTERAELRTRLAAWRQQKRRTEELWASVVALFFDDAGSSLIGGRIEPVDPKE